MARLSQHGRGQLEWEHLSGSYLQATMAHPHVHLEGQSGSELWMMSFSGGFEEEDHLDADHATSLPK